MHGLRRRPAGRGGRARRTARTRRAGGPGATEAAAGDGHGEFCRFGFGAPCRRARSGLASKPTGSPASSGWSASGPRCDACWIRPTPASRMPNGCWRMNWPWKCHLPPAERRAPGLDPLPGSGFPLHRAVRREAGGGAAPGDQSGDRRDAGRRCWSGRCRRLDTEAEASLPDGEALPPSWDRQRLLAVVLCASSLVPSSASSNLSPRSRRRRLARDQTRLYEYHERLSREAGRRLVVWPAGDDRRGRERQRTEAIQGEDRAGLDDLGRKYALRVASQWAETLDLVVRGQRLEPLIRRRKGERTAGWTGTRRRGGWNRRRASSATPPGGPRVWCATRRCIWSARPGSRHARAAASRIAAPAIPNVV